MFVGLVPRPAFLRHPRRRPNPVASAITLSVAGVATMLLATAMVTQIPAQSPVGALVVLEPVQIVAQR
jgi:hypothetical protein